MYVQSNPSSLKAALWMLGDKEWSMGSPITAYVFTICFFQFDEWYKPKKYCILKKFTSKQDFHSCAQCTAFPLDVTIHIFKYGPAPKI